MAQSNHMSHVTVIKKRTIFKYTKNVQKSYYGRSIDAVKMAVAFPRTTASEKRS